MAPEAVEHGQDAFVGACLVEAVVDVVRAERVEHRFEAFGGQVRRHGVLHEETDAVAQHLAHLSRAAQGQSVSAQGVVDAVGQVLQRVEQGAVEVEDDGRDFLVHSRDVLWFGVQS